MLLMVRCPICGSKSQMRRSISGIAEALLLKNVIRLHARCHDLWWDASFSERQEIRKVLIEIGRQESIEQSNMRASL
jgi:hypothetical protein